MIGRGTLLLFAVAAASGCTSVASVFPVVSDSTVYDRRLEGEWTGSAPGDDHTSSVILYTNAPDTLTYRVVRINQTDVSRYEGRLGRLGPYRVFDLQPTTELPGGLVIPLRGLVVIDSIGDELTIRTLNGDSLVRYLKRNPKALSHVMTGGQLVLTARTPELRAFLLDLLRQPGMLGKPQQAVRR